MNFLRRALAPLADEAWKAIDDEARSVLVANLAARHFVDVRGPSGLQHAAVNLGTLGPIKEEHGVRYGVRRVLPLVELRVPFAVDRWALDDLSRGADDVDLQVVRKAAHRAAQFEETAVYRGLAGAGIEGIVANSAHEKIRIAPDGPRIVERVTAAYVRLADTGVDGPLLLVLGELEFKAVTAHDDAYPPRRDLEALLGRPPVYSPGLTGGLLVSRRGGDFLLDLGIDHSIGFDHADGKSVHLYLTESFYFQVTGPEAVVVLERA